MANATNLTRTLNSSAGHSVEDREVLFGGTNASLQNITGGKTNLLDTQISEFNTTGKTSGMKRKTTQKLSLDNDDAVLIEDNNSDDSLREKGR